MHPLHLNALDPNILHHILDWDDSEWYRCGLHELTLQKISTCIILYHFGDSLDSFVFMLRVPVLGGAQIIAFAGLIETTGFFQAASTTDGRGPREGQFAMKDSTETGEPGNYGVGFPNFLGKVEDPEARKSKLAAELANGRLAMMAIIGMFFQVRCWKALAVATAQMHTYNTNRIRYSYVCLERVSLTLVNS